MKHTPGKWEVTKDHPVFEGKTIVAVWDEENSKPYRDKYKMICELTEIRGDSFTDNSEYTKANAALIASAPELLKENEQLKESLKTYQEDKQAHLTRIETLKEQLETGANQYAKSVMRIDELKEQVKVLREALDWDQIFDDAQTMHLQEFINYYKNKTK